MFLQILLSTYIFSPILIDSVFQAQSLWVQCNAVTYCFSKTFKCLPTVSYDFLPDASFLHSLHFSEFRLWLGSDLAHENLMEPFQIVVMMSLQYSCHL